MPICISIAKQKLISIHFSSIDNVIRQGTREENIENRFVSREQFNIYKFIYTVHQCLNVEKVK